METSVVVCTDLSGKKPHGQVGMGIVMTSGSLGCIMFSTLAQNARDVDSIPALGIVLPIFITPTRIPSLTYKIEGLSRTFQCKLPGHLKDAD